MAFMKIQYPTGVSPKGVAVYPHVNKPDPINPDKPAFKVGLRVDEGNAQDLIGRIDALMAALTARSPKVLALLSEQEAQRLTTNKKAKAAEVPYGVSLDADKNDIEGFIDFKFRANAQYAAKDGAVIKRTVPLYDAKGKPTAVEVWGGSELRVSYMLRPWVNAKAEYGVKLAMEAVQVITVRSGAARDALGFGFGEEDGFEASDESTDTHSGRAGMAGPSDDNEDF